MFSPSTADADAEVRRLVHRHGWYVVLNTAARLLLAILLAVALSAPLSAQDAVAELELVEAASVDHNADDDDARIVRRVCFNTG